jgi:hypothetical protein
MINYSTLISANHTGATILQAEYYKELPQTTKQMNDGNGSAYNLLTFNGPTNICTLNPAAVQAQLFVLDVTFQDGPVNLQPARFNFSSA